MVKRTTNLWDEKEVIHWSFRYFDAVTIENLIDIFEIMITDEFLLIRFLITY